MRAAVVGTVTGHPASSLVVACVALAAMSVVVFPASLGFDPWAWVVWGRELSRLELTTTGGPSWKPLPVVVTTATSPFGELSPDLWMVVARAAGLLLVAGCYQLARRFAGPAAGLVAAGLVLLAPDEEPRFLRTLAEGHEAPMSAALAVWAIERHLSGRGRTTLMLLTGLALLRPESWPFLLVYAGWLWPRDPAVRTVLVGCVAIVPVLWFGGDWWGSGSPLHGAEVAQVTGTGPVRRTGEALETLGRIVVLPAWALAIAGTAMASARRRSPEVAIAALALIWCTTVVLMAAVLRYAAISRFFLPAAALLCVLAGAGTVRVAAWTRARGNRLAALAVLVVAAGLAAPRALGIEDVLDEVEWRADLERTLPAAVEGAGGRDAADECGTVGAETWTALRPAIAWELDVPLPRVRRTPIDPPVLVFTVAGSSEDRRLAALGPVQAPVVATSGDWTVRALGCLAG